MEIPGQQLEKAAGEVVSEAGKTLIGALRRRIDAWSAVKSAKDEAEAKEIKKNAEHQGEIRRQRELHDERRSQEKNEVEHFVELTGLAQRGVQRLVDQLADEQKRVEWVGSRSIHIANEDPDSKSTREVPDDWLKRFFKYAADVDENEVLEILARGLADAAIRGRPILTPKALDALRFFELASFDMFKFCSREIACFGALPADMLENRAYLINFKLDVVLMLELGLIKEDRQKFFNVNFGDVTISFSYDTGVNYEFRVFKLTYVGISIATLLDRRYGELISEIQASRFPNKIALLQKDIELQETQAQSLARHLISQMCDTSEIDIRLNIVKSGQALELISKRRKSPLDEFYIEIPDEIAKNRSNDNEMTISFLKSFEDFDRNQLPYLYTDIEREDLRSRDK